MITQLKLHRENVLRKTQRQVARAARVRAALISEIEHGIHPPQRNAERIARAYGLTLAQIMVMQRVTPFPSEIQAQNVEIARKLSKQELKKILEDSTAEREEFERELETDSSL